MIELIRINIRRPRFTRVFKIIKLELYLRERIYICANIKNIEGLPEKRIKLQQKQIEKYKSWEGLEETLKGCKNAYNQ